mmetsp:Transcript_16377/g.18882  ORF Transcript_16377/g.18882 Transcript_16377/m.18882 type:complete len:301 (+) Transcript_16377:19-921(+)
MISISISTSSSHFMEPSEDTQVPKESPSDDFPARSPPTLPVVRLRHKPYLNPTKTTTSSYNPAKRIKEEEFLDRYYTFFDETSRDDKISGNYIPSKSTSTNKKIQPSIRKRELLLPYLPKEPTTQQTINNNDRGTRILSSSDPPLSLQPSPKSPLSQSMQSMKIHSFLSMPPLKDDGEDNDGILECFNPKPSASFYPIRCLDEPQEILLSSRTVTKNEAYPLPRRPRQGQPPSLFKQEAENAFCHSKGSFLSEKIILEDQEASSDSIKSSSILSSQQKGNENNNNCAFSPFVRIAEKKNS